MQITNKTVHLCIVILLSVYCILYIYIDPEMYKLAARLHGLPGI